MENIETILALKS